MMNLNVPPTLVAVGEGFNGRPSAPGPLRCRHHTIESSQSTGAITCAKYYRQPTRALMQRIRGYYTSSSNIDDRSIWAGVRSIIYSYNQINQTHICESSYVMTKLANQDLQWRSMASSSRIGRPVRAALLAARLRV
ncbi:BZ3501_MvSof-1269-A2-R1_Chr7-2g09348 [Microbotryum saponariae]|nr:BZ3501_MvSof-1269-A2-R1_Chr7-2g09348 [Microbotryum saponariae]